MRLKDYIRHLQGLHQHYGDIDVTVHTKCMLENLDFDEYYSTADRPYYSKDGNCIVVHSNYIRYDDYRLK